MITILTNGRLLDCIGDEPMEDASVVVEEGEIKDIYSGEKPKPDGATIINLDGRTVLPGLIDAHEHPTYTHFELRNYSFPPLLKALQIIEQLELTLQGGFTTVCDKDGANWTWKQAIEDGIVKGPRLLIACAMITKTGGHSDFGGIRGSMDAVPKDTGLVAIRRIADGPDACRKAAREQLRDGADFVKICATGGAGTPSDEPSDVGYSEEEIRTFVEEAEDNETYVAAHCLNNKGIKRAIKCGVRSIDHGVGFDEEAAHMLKERGFFHVPTLSNYKMWAEQGAELGVPAYLIRKSAAIQEETMRSVELTHRLGCNVGFGTDRTFFFWGMQGREIKLKTECGMSPYESIKSATIVNARLLRMEDKIGTIEIGKWADIIVVDGHPDEDAEILGRPDNVKLVMKQGEIMKNIL